MEFPSDTKLKEELISAIRSGSAPLDPIETGVKKITGPLKKIKSVIFDIYGTLFISASGDVGTSKKHSKSEFIAEAIRKSGISIKNNTRCEKCDEYFYSIVAGHHKKLKDKGYSYPEVNILSVWEEFLSGTADRGIISGYFTEVQIIKAALYFELLANPVWPMPGLTEILSGLKACGIPLGIISNAQFYTPLLFEALAGGTAEELGFKKEITMYSFEYLRAKPSSFMFDKVLQQLYNESGIHSGEILYVGNDMLNDIKTASAAGMKTVLFAGDKRSLRLRESECPDTVPDAVITSLKQLDEVIDIN